MHSLVSRNPTLDINALSTALVVLDDRYKICNLNSSAEQLLGFSTRQLEAENFFDLVKGDFNQDMLDQIRLKEHTSFIEDIELKVAVGIVVTNAKITPCKLYSDNDLLLELQTSEYHQNIRKDLRLQQQSRVSEHLIRNLAHEIKNPLGGIKVAAQVLERKIPNDFPKKYTRIIIREADRLGALVDRLLMPAKPELKRLINLHLLIEHALEIVLLQTDPCCDINKDYDPSLPEIEVSPNQIQQALLNLIKNAFEAIQLSKEKDKNGKLVIKTRITHQHTIGKIQHRQVIKIEIKDNGIGIPAELENDIFFPTISGKESSGLGLSIAQSLAQRHGGIIELEQNDGLTSFSIYLPI